MYFHPLAPRNLSGDHGFGLRGLWGSGCPLGPAPSRRGGWPLHPAAPGVAGTAWRAQRVAPSNINCTTRVVSVAFCSPANQHPQWLANCRHIGFGQNDVTLCLSDRKSNLLSSITRHMYVERSLFLDRSVSPACRPPSPPPRVAGAMIIHASPTPQLDPL